MSIWEPRFKENTNMYRFIQYVNEKRKKNFKNYWDLYSWSVNEIENFWEDVWDFVGIIYSRKFVNVVEDLKKFPGTKWFVGAKLNFAENLLRFRDDRKAIIFRGEPGSGKGEEITYNSLYKRVAALNHYLSRLGVKPGDRVAAYMPNIPETIISMLSSTSLGASWSSAGTELGPKVLLDRFTQISPRIIFTVDGYRYKGKDYSTMETLKIMVENIDAEKIIIFPNLNRFERIKGEKIVYADEIDHRSSNEIKFEQVDANDPLYIMFSSGTTGKPKSMVQSVAGVLVNHLKELIIHSDLRREDTISYITSPSWMMWNWLVSSLAVGSTLFLYDGNPLYPDWKTMWNFVEKEKITIFGCSASYIYSLKSMDAKPAETYNLVSLREISQTGSPLSREGYRWVYENIKKEIHLNSISGGTDINGCFAIGSPCLPVNEGEIQSPGLGMKIKCYDDEGNEILDSVGELVCEAPSPSMPLYFLNDPGNERYIETYFSYYRSKGKNVWRHGDFVIFHSKTGGITILGRSDSTLKPSGVRIGTAEIYSVLETMPEIADSVVVGRETGTDQEIILFVKMKDGIKLNEEIKKKIRESLKKNCSPRHVPDRIIEVKDIPYTLIRRRWRLQFPI